MSIKLFSLSSVKNKMKIRFYTIYFKHEFIVCQEKMCHLSLCITQVFYCHINLRGKCQMMLKFEEYQQIVTVYFADDNYFMYASFISRCISFHY